MRAQILVTSYWLHIELGKNIEKILCQKIIYLFIYFLSYNFLKLLLIFYVVLQPRK
jgi:hypothetical protein